MSQLGEQGSPAALTDPARKVGYGKPPEAHRFKKGVSGNPKGRPREKLPAGADGPPSEVYDLFRRVANRKMEVSIGGKVRTVTGQEAVLHLLQAKALRGEIQAIRLYLELGSAGEQSRRKERLRHFERELDYKRRSAERIHHADVNGYPPFEPLPHPDDMKTDSEQDQSVVNGPSHEIRKKQRGRSEKKRKNIESAAMRGDPPFEPSPQAEHTEVDSELDRIIGKGSPTEFKKKQWAKSEIERQIIESAIEELEALRIWPADDLGDDRSRKQVAAKLEYWRELLARLDAYYPSAEQRAQPGFNLQQWRKQNVRDHWDRPVFE